ncbi:MAG: hypothetical protein RLY86_4419 [Pseudomonadota bacterium]|jgi:uncharacterized membrane protein
MTRNRRDWALVASLALNLFLGAAVLPVAISIMRGEPPPFAPPVGPPSAWLGDLGDRLSAEDRRVLQSALPPPEQVTTLLRLAPRRIGEAQAALRADPFDPAAVVAPLADWTEARTRMELEQLETLAAAAGRMSPEGRRILSEWEGPVRLITRMERDIAGKN